MIRVFHKSHSLCHPTKSQGLFIKRNYCTLFEQHYRLLVLDFPIISFSTRTFYRATSQFHAIRNNLLFVYWGQKYRRTEATTTKSHIEMHVICVRLDKSLTWASRSIWNNRFDVNADLSVCNCFSFFDICLISCLIIKVEIFPLNIYIFHVWDLDKLKTFLEPHTHTHQSKLGIVFHRKPMFICQPLFLSSNIFIRLIHCVNK